MIQELEDVLVLVRLLPERHQKEAARRLQQVVLRAEEETMSFSEQMRLMELRSKERGIRIAATLKRIQKLAKDLE